MISFCCDFFFSVVLERWKHLEAVRVSLPSKKSASYLLSLCLDTVSWHWKKTSFCLVAILPIKPKASCAVFYFGFGLRRGNLEREQAKFWILRSCPMFANFKLRSSSKNGHVWIIFSVSAREALQSFYAWETWARELSLCPGSFHTILQQSVSLAGD